MSKYLEYLKIDFYRLFNLFFKILSYSGVQSETLSIYFNSLAELEILEEPPESLVSPPFPSELSGSPFISNGILWLL